MNEEFGNVILFDNQSIDNHKSIELNDQTMYVTCEYMNFIAK